MLADLMNTPRTASDWAVWSFAHRDSHALIRQAIQAKYGVSLTEYALDPIDPEQQERWLARNQLAHNDFNGVLKTQGSNLEQVDFKNPSQLEAWIYLHRLEHEAASDSLGVS